MTKTDADKKDGVTVQQLEHFGKKHCIEIFFCIMFIFSSFFSFVFYGPGWSIYATGLGGAIAVWIPKLVGRAALGTLCFCLKQQTVTRIVIGVVGIVLSIFLPPIVFLCIGLVAGRSFHRHTIEAMKKGDACRGCDHDDHHA
jgi:hypothetical protein